MRRSKKNLDPDKKPPLSVNIHEAKTNLSRLLKMVEEQHVTVRVCRDGKVIAQLTPVVNLDRQLASEPQLKVVYKDNIFETSEDEWPKELR